MSYLSISGLDPEEQDNALHKLLQASSSTGTPQPDGDPFQEAVRPTTPPDDARHPNRPSSVKPFSAGVPSVKSSSIGASSVKPSSAPLPPLAAFRADPPAAVDALPAVEDLLHGKLRRAWTEALCLREMTRIQQLSWAAVLDRERDVIIRSETGSGKTLAYALPTLHQILCECDANPIRRDIGTLVIVMCPTRELVIQVENTFRTLLKFAQFLTVGAIHGGENRHKEKSRLRKGIPLLITTPGRLLDHLKATVSFNVSNARTLIMDEADRLLDLGFEKAIREIVELLATKCSNASELKRVLVSATITEGVERLSHFALRPRITRVGETQDTFTIPVTLQQNFVVVPTKHRLAVLVSFLRAQLDAGTQKIVVFVSTADSTEFLFYLLSRLESPFLRRNHQGKTEVRRSNSKKYKKMLEAGNQHIHDPTEEVITFDEDRDDDTQETEMDRKSSLRAMLDVNVFKLHGNMSQVDRASVFHAFKYGNPGMKNQKSVLFCTDVAARGLDMPLIDWIVHYDPPTDPASYVHRIGRTARIGKSGNSILFLAPHEVGYARYLANFIGSGAQDGKPAGLEEDKPHPMSEKKYETYLFYLTKLDPGSNHMWIHSTAKLERAMTYLVMREPSSEGEHREERTENLCRLALFAYQSYIRSYAGIPKDLKRQFFSSSDLHLGHLAQSFGIEKSPTEVQRQLQRYIREDRALGRRAQKRIAPTGGSNGEGAQGKAKRERIELEHEGRYHSMLAQKQRKTTRDYEEKRRGESLRIRPLQFTEFDA
ncbi:unnamed protein product [Phytomonas sp. EM1]|nr:unnamed protein product [Phytomonas sp. EM1]|eukprot:CCW61025.1 unnamed protein product [Phytomonas sp. isolate EM1]